MKSTMTITTHNVVGISTYDKTVFGFGLRAQQGVCRREKLIERFSFDEKAIGAQMLIVLVEQPLGPRRAHNDLSFRVFLFDNAGRM